MAGKQILEFFANYARPGEASDYTAIVVVRREIRGGPARRFVDWLSGRPHFYEGLVVEGVYYFQGGLLVEGFDNERASKSTG